MPKKSAHAKKVKRAAPHRTSVQKQALFQSSKDWFYFTTGTILICLAVFFIFQLFPV